MIIIVIGNKTKDYENNDFGPTCSRAADWCCREKMQHFIASMTNRNSLYKPFVYLTSKLNPPPSKSTFSQLSMGRKITAKDT